MVHAPRQNCVLPLAIRLHDCCTCKHMHWPILERPLVPKVYFFERPGDQQPYPRTGWCVLNAEVVSWLQVCGKAMLRRLQ